MPISLQQRWDSRMTRWLDSRIPRARQFQLDMRSIFIFPSKFGWLYLLLCLGLFLLGTNYQNNLMLLLCYFLVALFLVTLMASYLNFSRIQVQLGKVHNVFAGDQLKLPIWFHLAEKAGQRPHGQAQLGFWRQHADLQVDFDALTNPNLLPYPCHTRGRLTLPRVTLSAGYPLGLYRCWTHLAFDAHVLVYPTPVPCNIELHGRNDGTEEVQPHASSQGYDDFDALSPYQKGEPLYHVAWKQVAKGQGMVSKRFSTPGGRRGWLVLPGSEPQELEKNLGKLCFQVLELSRANQIFGLELGNLRIAPDSGPEHQQACLEALALFQRGEKHD